MIIKLVGELGIMFWDLKWIVKQVEKCKKQSFGHELKNTSNKNHNPKIVNMKYME